MIKHIVWWTLQPHAEGHSAHENAKKLKIMLDKLRDLECVQHLETVVNIMPSSTEEVDILLLSIHSTVADLKEYAAHPDHMEVADFVRKIVSTRKTIDYEV